MLSSLCLGVLINASGHCTTGAYFLKGDVYHWMFSTSQQECSDTIVLIPTESPTIKLKVLPINYRSRRSPEREYGCIEEYRAFAPLKMS